MKTQRKDHFTLMKALLFLIDSSYPNLYSHYLI